MAQITASPAQSLRFKLLTLMVAVWTGFAVQIPVAMAQDRSVIVVLGDSLTAGYGLSSPETTAFPAQLQDALEAQGRSVEIRNAGVSGDTATGGLNRLAWSVADDVDGVIVELGANDALRGTNPSVPREALDQIVQQLKDRNITVLLTGMMAPPNLGPDYAAEFNAIYPDLAEKHEVALYPFFLDGVAAERHLNQADGIHPTVEGIGVIVDRILPTVETFLDTLQTGS